MSKAERRAFQISETKDHVYHRDEGVCRSCGRLVEYPGVLAHHIPQTEANLKKYGAEVIHHPDNLALVCRDPDCNDLQGIGVDPIWEAMLVTEIRLQIEADSVLDNCVHGRRDG